MKGQGFGRGRCLVTGARSGPLIAHVYQQVARVSVLVTLGAEKSSCGHGLDGRRARHAPGPRARGRGSSRDWPLWPASAAGSPPCSRAGKPVPSSSAGGERSGVGAEKLPAMPALAACACAHRWGPSDHR